MEKQIAVFIDFENVALWAEREFFDFELTPLIEYLQSRGPVVVKRAYGDWSRFLRYRDELMNLSIDLIQYYSVRAGKNRADIRMAIDALEVAVTRDNIQNFVIVSGDSDFGPLVVKLREYGKYTLGIGPRNITHDLLVRSCDEFIYLETLLGGTSEVTARMGSERDDARNTLFKALQAHGQRGELPVLAAKLKQTMLLINPAFNEINFGYSQFKSWLEDNRELVKLYMRDLQLYVAPIDFVEPPGMFAASSEVTNPNGGLSVAPNQALDSQYRELFSQLKMPSVDFDTRRDVLRDIYRLVSKRPGELTAEETLDALHERYEQMELVRPKPGLREIMHLSFRQQGFSFGGQEASWNVPLWPAEGIENEADFIRRAESDFVFDIIHTGLELDPAEVAYVMLNDRDQVDYIQSLIDDLRQRGLVARRGKRYTLPGHETIPFCDEPYLQPICRDIEELKLPTAMPHGVNVARNLAKAATVQRSQDFAASALSYLQACKLLWNALERNEVGATLQDLRWYMASYASANAGKLSQVDHDYEGARPYYLAFFSLVQEGDPLWSRMRGLINPMLSYYWANLGRELEIDISSWNLSAASPAQIAVIAATHPKKDLRDCWHEATSMLAQVNPGLLRRIADQIQINRGDSPGSLQVAEQIRQLIQD
jgi:uncharacterized protein (TIGR00288 family)